VDKDRAHLTFSSESLIKLKSHLEVVLSKIEAFATRKNLETFAKAFRAAKEVLFSGEPLSRAHHSDLAPACDFPLEAKQLLGVAWVFGGMGSWNELQSRHVARRDVSNRPAVQGQKLRCRDGHSDDTSLARPGGADYPVASTEGIDFG
jgi:hypothetical protein